ncbi:MAG: hypothetical protein EOO15_14410 [Chitinophagaceae bacterium]|nr:MAG: hypothetical protein EOO15_14410 [Chitinophagaceae bacterium]
MEKATVAASAFCIKIKIMRVLALLSLLLCCGKLQAQQPDSVRHLVDSALRVMEHRALTASKLNWSAIRSEVELQTAFAQTAVEAAPALFWAFDQLQDKHGWITINDSAHHNPYLFREKRTLSDGLRAALRNGPRIYNGTIARKYAYVSIHFFMDQTLDAMNAYAQRIQDSLCKNVTPDTRGVIIDLRINGGGNSFPMYQGIVNVLGNRDFAEGVDGNGRTLERFGIRNNRVVMRGNAGDSMVLHLERMCSDLANLPVAVLISPVSGSAAEQLAIAFTARPRSVLIGERTAGYVTANNGFLLPGTNNGIVLAESLTRNLKGKLFDEDVRPDVEVIGGDDFTNRELDAKIQAAVRWLEQQR